MGNKMKNGVYDISIEEYHSGEGISRSSLLEFLKTPYHYWYKKNNPEVRENVDIIKKNNAMEFGNALHTYVLEKEQFFDRYFVMPKINKTTKAGKEAYAQACEESKNKSLICVEAMREIEKMGFAIENHQFANPLIADALYEKSIYWSEQDTGLLCKVRPDIWHDDFICDLKTCASASHHDFQKSILNYGYHIQAGMIHEALKVVAGKEVKNFVFIAIEKEPPYAIGVYQLDDNALQKGIQKFKEIINGIKRCLDANEWPSYPPGLIDLPSWA
jgi:hypothetical protein